MRTAVSVILVFLTIPLFVIGLAATTLKFQLLEPDFWQNTFEKNGVYTELTTIVKQSVIEQTVKEGGRPSDITAITDLITTANIKDFVDKNLQNLLNFANDRVTRLMVYVPVERAPNGFLPKNFENLPQTMPLDSLLTKLNIMGISTTEIQYISLLGKGSFYLLVLDSALFLIFLIFLFVLTNPGERFIWPGIAIILDGFTSLTLYFYLNRAVSNLTSLIQKTDTAQAIIVAVAPPLVNEILKIWLIVGIVAVLLGIVILLIKKQN